MAGALAALWLMLTLTAQAQKIGDLKIEPYVFEAGSQQKADATLALGSGANTAIFSVVCGVLLKPPPYPDAERLVVGKRFAARFQRLESSEPEF